MDKQQADKITELLDQLTNKADKKDITVFTDEQSTALLELATFWGQVKAAAALGSKIGSGLKWVVVFIASWAALKAGIVDWLKMAVNK